MAAKSAQAFRTIREVADWLGVAAHVLRFWESKFTQIKPVKRAGGRRYYRPSDMELVGGIKVLLHDRGMTIRGVKKMISDEGIDAISALSPPIDSLLEEPDVIDITPDKEWEADAVAERLAADQAAQTPDAPEDAPGAPAAADASAEAVEDPWVETAEEIVDAGEAEQQTMDLAEPPDAEDVATPPASAPAADAVQSAPDDGPAVETGPSPRPAASEGALTRLADLSRRSGALAPHLPALRALRDRMTGAPGTR